MDFSEYTWVRWEGIQPSTYTSLKTTQIVSKIPSNLGEDWENCEIYTCYAVQCLVTQSWPVLCDPKDCSPPGSSVHEDSPGKNTGVGSHSFLQGIFPTRVSNPGLPHCRQILDSLSHQGRPKSDSLPYCKWAESSLCKGWQLNIIFSHVNKMLELPKNTSKYRDVFLEWFQG